MNSRTWLTKVPAITATFWVIKVLSTTIGETFSDYLTVNVGLGAALTDTVMATVLAVALVIQFRTRRYTPWIYWLCVVLVSVVGTEITDFFTDTLGVSLYLSTAVFAVVLAVVFVVWHRQEGTLAIASIDTPRRETFYWAAILTTFALGTAGGDLATEALGLGFRNGVLIFGGLILAVWIAWKAGAGQVVTFWIAYVLTRPLGASLGDLLTQAKEFGGLALGASATSVLFFAVILVLVTREQLLAGRHGVVAKGSGPAGGYWADYAWAGLGLVVVATVGWGLSAARTDEPAATALAVPGQAGPGQAGPGQAGPGNGGNGAPGAGSNGNGAPGAGSNANGGSGTGTMQPQPTTRLGDLTSFATIVSDVEGRVARDDLSGGRTRIKDLEVAWDDAEAGLKPRDPGKWHRLDDQIDAALGALRAGHPSQGDCAATLNTLGATLDQFDGV